MAMPSYVELLNGNNNNNQEWRRPQHYHHFNRRSLQYLELQPDDARIMARIAVTLIGMLLVLWYCEVRAARRRWTGHVNAAKQQVKLDIDNGVLMQQRQEQGSSSPPASSSSSAVVDSSSRAEAPPTDPLVAPVTPESSHVNPAAAHGYTDIRTNARNIITPNHKNRDSDSDDSSSDYKDYESEDPQSLQTQESTVAAAMNFGRAKFEYFYFDQLSDGGFRNFFQCKGVLDLDHIANSIEANTIGRHEGNLLWHGHNSSRHSGSDNNSTSSSADLLVDLIDASYCTISGFGTDRRGTFVIKEGKLACSTGRFYWIQQSTTCTLTRRVLVTGVIKESIATGEFVYESFRWIPEYGSGTMTYFDIFPEDPIGPSSPEAGTAVAAAVAALESAGLKDSSSSTTITTLGLEESSPSSSEDGSDHTCNDDGTVKKHQDEDIRNKILRGERIQPEAHSPMLAAHFDFDPPSQYRKEQHHHKHSSSSSLDGDGKPSKESFHNDCDASSFSSGVSIDLDASSLGDRSHSKSRKVTPRSLKNFKDEETRMSILVRAATSNWSY